MRNLQVVSFICLLHAKVMRGGVGRQQQQQWNQTLTQTVICLSWPRTWRNRKCNHIRHPHSPLPPPLLSSTEYSIVNQTICYLFFFNNVLFVPASLPCSIPLALTSSLDLLLLLQLVGSQLLAHSHSIFYCPSFCLCLFFCSLLSFHYSFACSHQPLPRHSQFIDFPKLLTLCSMFAFGKGKNYHVPLPLAGALHYTPRSSPRDCCPPGVLAETNQINLL